MSAEKAILLTGSRAASTSNVLRVLDTYLRRHGYATTTLVPFDMNPVRYKNFHGAVFMMPLIPHASRGTLVWYNMMSMRTGGRTYWYTVVEGILPPEHFMPGMYQHVKFVAASEYVRQKLAEVDIKACCVIPHAVDLDMIKRIEPLRRKIRRELEQKFGDKVIFGVVSSALSRKGLPKLASALTMLPQDIAKQIAVAAITDKNGMDQLAPAREAVDLQLYAEFGSLVYEEALAFEGAVDYLIMPTLAEGFGLPLIEANAQGVPVIHADFPPLSEITDRTANITFPYLFIKPGENYYGLTFELHMYDDAELANAITLAAEEKLNNPQAYQERRARAMENGARFDVEKVYAKWLELFG